MAQCVERGWAVTRVNPVGDGLVGGATAGREAQPQRFGALGLTQAALPDLAGDRPGPDVVDPPAQRRLFVLVLRREPPTYVP